MKKITNKYSSAEVGTDKPRNLKQFIFRIIAQSFVNILRLNKPSNLSTEIVSQNFIPTIYLPDNIHLEDSCSKAILAG